MVGDEGSEAAQRAVVQTLQALLQSLGLIVIVTENHERYPSQKVTQSYLFIYFSLKVTQCFVENGGRKRSWYWSGGLEGAGGVTRGIQEVFCKWISQALLLGWMVKGKKRQDQR